MNKKIRLFAALTIFIMAFGTNLKSQNHKIYINEFLSSNVSINMEMVDFGDFSDWIELYNDESFEVDLSGYFLTDNPSEPTQWVIPNNTKIGGKGFLIIWADGFDDSPGQTYTRPWWPSGTSFTTKNYHSNFKLNDAGEFIGLYNSGGLIVDSITYDNQVDDISFARYPDGTGQWKFSTPTPDGRNNPGIDLPVFTTEVEFSTAGGVYDDSFLLSLNVKNGSGEIRYTDDGSIPKETSTLYSSPLIIQESVVIRARVFEDQKFPGKTITNSYLINKSHDLPVVSISTNPENLWDKELGIYLNSYKDREIPVSFEIFDANGNYKTNAGMQIGGENIYRFAQKPLNIYARGRYGDNDLKYKFFNNFNYAEYDKLYLRNGGDDWPFTMFKDGMIGNIVRGKVSNSLQAFNPAVLYLNGAYWGIQNMREKLDDKYFELHYNTEAIDLDHLESNYNIISGSADDYLSLLTYISISDMSDSNNYSYVSNNVDLLNLMDFVIVQDYLGNTSWGHNRELWRDRGAENKWRWVLVDMDRGFYTSRINYNLISDLYSSLEIFRKLMENNEFRSTFLQRYANHINDTFNSDRVVAIIDSVSQLLESEMPNHISKWSTYIDSLSIKEWGIERGIQSMSAWRNNIEGLKTFANERPNNALRILGDFFETDGTLELALSSVGLDAPSIYISDFKYTAPSVLKYFAGFPINLKAMVPPGYKFDNWSSISSTTSNTLLIEHGANWKYFNQDQAPVGDWKGIDFDDSGWSSGSAKFGYGEGDESTVLDYGSNSSDKYSAYYFRKTFNVSDISDIESLSIKVQRDDGAIIYLNGVEVVRSNMPTGVVGYETNASETVGGSDEDFFFEFNVDQSILTNGTNLVAVEIHQVDGGSSDISFDLELIASNQSSTGQSVVLGTADSVSVTLTGNTEIIANFSKIDISELPGTISGNLTLTKDKSPYYVTQNITVTETGVLKIERGVEVIISPNYSIIVTGQLIATGTEEDKINFHSVNEDENWGSIIFSNSASSSVLDNVIIKNAGGVEGSDDYFAAISLKNSIVTISNSLIADVGIPIFAKNSNLIVDYCEFRNVSEIGDYINSKGGTATISNSKFLGNNNFDTDGIDLDYVLSGTINNNLIENFTGSNSDGIDIGEASQNVLISNNIIRICGDKGVSIGQGSEVKIEFSLIQDCLIGVGVKDSFSVAEIDHVTFANNEAAAAVYEKTVGHGGAELNVINSIFYNSTDTDFTVDGKSSGTVSYSISDTRTLTGSNNLSGAPGFINPGGNNYFLQANSLSLGKASPESQVRDLGAYYFKGQSGSKVVINEINYNSSALFDTEDWIEILNNSDGRTSLSDWVFMDENNEPSFVLPEGTYLDVGAYLIICREQQKFASRFTGIENLFFNMASGLSGSGESIFLYSSDGFLIDSLTYRDSAPWPTDADGNGPTLELDDPSSDNSNPNSWSASPGHGTPGERNTLYTDVDGEESVEITDFRVSQNFPNPFNPETRIRYSIPEESNVSIIVYNSLGEEIRQLLSENLDKGYYETSWQPEGVSSGVFFIKVIAQAEASSRNFSEVIKVIYLK